MNKIGLLGAVVMIIGTVIGAGIYIMIGPLAVETGPSLFVCYLLALVIATTSSICYAQVGSVFPTTAGTYRYAAMFFSDFIGFLIGWLRYVAGFYLLALMGLGFADYFDHILMVDQRILAVAAITFFYMVNVLGITTTRNVQGVMVFLVVAGLIMFSSSGVFKMDPSNLTPIFGAGVSPILYGSVTAFFAFTGVNVVAEIGEEIKDPHKNIPRSIGIAMVIIGVLYLTTALVFSGGLGWEKIVQHEPNLAQASSLIHSPMVSYLISLCAIAAIITPLNSIYLASSRGLYILAEDGLMPSFLYRLNRFKVPGVALTLIYILGTVMVLVDLPILFLGTIGSAVTLLAMCLVAGGCLKIGRDYPAELRDAPFSLSKPVLFFAAGLTIAIGVVLLVVTFFEEPLIFYTLFFWAILGSAFYYYRKRYLKQKENRLLAG